MRIGLVRHFKVNYNKPKFFMAAAEFEEWVRHYDEADIFQMEIKQEETNWEYCFSSDLPRAVHTAEKMASCSIAETGLLREVPLNPFIKTKKKLPYPLWNLAGRLAWFFSHSSQPETRKDTVKRAKRFIEKIEHSQKDNILVVSHGFFLFTLAKELEAVGYKGNRVRRFKNGELYIYERDQQP